MPKMLFHHLEQKNREALSQHDHMEGPASQQPGESVEQQLELERIEDRRKDPAWSEQAAEMESCEYLQDDKRSCSYEAAMGYGECGWIERRR